MTKLVNVRFVVALSVVVCASVFIGVSGARDIDSSPAEAPWVSPWPEQCRMSGPCGDFVGNLVVSKAFPTQKDVVCCKEIVQTTKYCWEKVMEVIEDLNVPAFANLHPWAEITWDKCVSLTGSLSQAPMISGNSPTQAPTWPEQCRISQSSIYTLTQLLVTKTFPSQKDVTCCREIIQTGQDCWEKTMAILEDPWAENIWNKCLILTN